MVFFIGEALFFFFIPYFFLVKQPKSAQEKPFSACALFPEPSPQIEVCCVCVRVCTCVCVCVRDVTSRKKKEEEETI